MQLYQATGEYVWKASQAMAKEKAQSPRCKWISYWGKEMLEPKDSHESAWLIALAVMLP